MALTETKAVEIADHSGPSEARRTATRVAQSAGFDEQDLGRIALVVTEMSTNIAKHAGRGWALLTAGMRADGLFFQAVAVDKGRGFDLAGCLPDGHSTAGSPGTGLGAIARLSESFDAYSQPGAGSVVFAEIRERHAARRTDGPLLLSGFSVPKHGELECGDAWTTAWWNDTSSIMVADGLGHGSEAAIAARQAVRTFENDGDLSPAAILERAHAALRPTRGATVAVARVDVAAKRVVFAGIGNIQAAIIGSTGTRHLLSHNGTVGHEVRKVQEFTYGWEDRSLLVMASDGLGTHWNIAAYPGLTARHPAVVAGVLYRDFGRERDDVTVVVGRESENGGGH